MRYRKTQVASEPLTHEESETILGRTKTFVEAKVLTDRDSLRDAKKSMALPYQATCDWLHDLEKMMINLSSRGYEKYHNKWMLEHVAPQLAGTLPLQLTTVPPQ